MAIEKLVLRHGWYGCDTGCCGTELVLIVDGDALGRRWSFDHPDGENEALEMAERLREEFGDEHAKTVIEIGDIACF